MRQGLRRWDEGTSVPGQVRAYERFLRNAVYWTGEALKRIPRVRRYGSHNSRSGMAGWAPHWGGQALV